MAEVQTPAVTVHESFDKQHVVSSSWLKKRMIVTARELAALKRLGIKIVEEAVTKADL